MGAHRFVIDEERRFHVYALLCDDGLSGYIKFGISSRVGERLSQIRGTCPIPAKYFCTVYVSSRKKHALLVEKALHKRFAARRATGEWFRFMFDRAEDKQDFNLGCKQVFLATMGPAHEWWSKVSIAALDRYVVEHRRAFGLARLKKRGVARGIRKKRRPPIGNAASARKELANYGLKPD